MLKLISTKAHAFMYKIIYIMVYNKGVHFNGRLCHNKIFICGRNLKNASELSPEAFLKAEINLEVVVALFELVVLVVQLVQLVFERLVLLLELSEHVLELSEHVVVLVPVVEVVVRCCSFTKLLVLYLPWLVLPIYLKLFWEAVINE